MGITFEKPFKPYNILKNKQSSLGYWIFQPSVITMMVRKLVTRWASKFAHESVLSLSEEHREDYEVKIYAR